MTRPGQLLPLSAAQQAFCFEEMLFGDGGARSALTFGIDFPTAVEPDRLDRALIAVVKRHPLLRARLVASGARLGLSVEQAPSTILTRLPDDADTLASWVGQPVGLMTFPLCRAAAAVVNGQTRLRVTAHHVIFDGESKDVFVRDLARAYAEPDGVPMQGGRSGEAPHWRAHVEREQAAARPEEISAGGRLERTLPTPALAAASRRPGTSSFVVNRDLAAIAQKAARRLNVSRFTIHLAAWHAALSCLPTQEGDVVTEIAVSTRRAGDGNKIGPFVTRFAIRSSAPRAQCFRSLALRLGDVIAQLRQERRGPQASPAGQAQVRGRPTVSYRRTTLRSVPWAGGHAFPVLLCPRLASDAPIAIRALQYRSSYAGVIDTDPGLLDCGDAQRLVSSWRLLLHAASRHLDIRIDELPMLKAV